MYVEKFEAKQTGILSKIIENQYPNISYNLIQKLFRKKDIKVNSKRVAKDIKICKGDEIVFFVSEENKPYYYEVIFEDENVLVVNKKRNIEVVSKSADDLVNLIKKDKNIEIFAVHRLDRNTEGIVLFAKTLEAKTELEQGFKDRTFEKFYLARVYGIVEKEQDELTSYLKKDENNSLVYISDKKLTGYEKIQTNYKLVKQYEDNAILEVELITGKTHQIRAHLAYIGHFIIGDEKYGNAKINRKFAKKYQNLIAFRVILHFLENSKLYYLNNKTFEIDKNKIDFLKNL